MNTDQLRLFIILSRHRSLARAAVELGLGQATVSERLKALEAEVGTPLFERQGRGVALTPAGEAFGPYAERALEVLRQGNESAQAAGEGRGGQVTVAVTVTSGAYLFAPALVAFQREHPNVQVRVRSAHSWDAPGLVLDGVAQLALISGPIAHPQIESVATFTAPLMLATSRARRLSRLTLAELAGEQLLVSYWGPGSQAFLERVKSARGDNTPERVWLELSPVELVKGMLIAGTGMSLLPEIAVRRELAAGDLVNVEVVDAGSAVRLPVWEINLIRPRRRPVPPNAAADALAQTLMRVLPTLIHS